MQIKQMKFLKKPIPLKKIRKYSNYVVGTNFSLANEHLFLPQKGIIKSSYLENMLDLGMSVSSLKMKGGYFYCLEKEKTGGEYFRYQNNCIIDANPYFRGGIKTGLVLGASFPLTFLYAKFLFNLIANKNKSNKL